MRENIVGNIPGFSRYYVSKEGRVYSKTSGTWKVMAQRISSNGYVNITLFSDTKQKLRTKVHILVAKIWIDNPKELPCVGHKDNVRTNNKVDNLYWCTYKENSQQMVRDGRHYVPALKLSLEEIDDLVKLYKNKTPIKQLESKFSTNRVQLYGYLDLRGIKRNFKTRQKAYEKNYQQ